MKVLHVGWVSNSINNIIALKNWGYEVYVLDTQVPKNINAHNLLKKYISKSHIFNLYENINDKNFNKKKYFKAFLSRYDKNIWKTKDYIKGLPQVDLVFFTWGVGVAPEIKLLSDGYPNTPFVHNLLTFPTSEKSILREMFELKLYKDIIKGIDGLIYASENMKKFIEKKYTESKNISSTTIPQGFCETYFPNTHLEKLSDKDNKKHIVFLGRFNNGNWNYVEKELCKLARDDIVIHCSSLSDIKNRKNFETFQPFDGNELISGDLATYITQFDASISTYNITKKRTRYSTSLPSRFLFPLISQLPIILPSGKLEACENFILNNGNGYIYKNIEEINDWLNDDECFNKAKKNSKVVANKMILDKKNHPINLFIQKLM